MSIHTNKIHLLDPTGIPGSFKTFCGLNLKSKDTTRLISKTTCGNCKATFKHHRSKLKTVLIPDKTSLKEYWTLASEKNYLDHLGTGRWSNVQSSRRKLLKSYLDTINQRTENWVQAAYDYAYKLWLLECKLG